MNFMLAIIVPLIRQEQGPSQLSEKLQPQPRYMQLQQVFSIQQQSQSAQEQLRAAKAKTHLLADRNHAPTDKICT